MRQVGITVSLAMAAWCACSTPARAQCMRWDAGVGGWNAYAFCEYDDGTGPALYLGYDYGVAKWTGTTWVLVGNFFDEGVYELCVYDDGTGPHLYAGGIFENYGTPPAPLRGLAEFVGGTWQPVGGGLPVSGLYGPLVYSLAVFDDGTGPKLYVGGNFQASSGGLTGSILSWDGSTWGGLGANPPAAEVAALCVFDDGTGPALHVGGYFATAGGLPVNNVAKWDGNGWSALGSGLTGGTYTGVRALAVWDDGGGPALFAGGTFGSAGGLLVGGLAKWNGNAWSSLPFALWPAMSNQVRGLLAHEDSSGSALYVCGMGPSFESPPYGEFGVGRWDGSNWGSLGRGVNAAGAIMESLSSFDDGHGGGPALWVGGMFGMVGGNLLSGGVARWHGTCSQPIDAFCVGDGSLARCPCAYYGSAGHGCANSVTPSGALLAATGTPNPDTLVLSSSGELPTSLSIFLQSDVMVLETRMFGDGLRCLGGHIRRLYMKSAVGGNAIAPASGDPSVSQRSAALGDALSIGAVRYYQVWYRDGAASFCGSALSNVSNGLRVVW